MDRKSILIIVLCFVVMGLWNFLLVPALYPPKPLPRGSTNAPAPILAGTNPPAVQSAPSPAPEAIEPTLPLFAAGTNVPEQTLELTNGNSRYIFTSLGGGLKRVELFGSTEGSPVTNRLAILNDFSATPSLALLAPSIQGDGVFELSRTANGSIRAEKALTNGLTIVKDFRPDSNYLLSATVRLENSSSNSLSLPQQDWFVGMATPADARDKMAGVFWYNGAKAEDVGAASYFSSGGGCQQRSPPLEYHGGSNNVFWAAIHSQFFVLAMMPLPMDKEPAQALVIRRMDLPRPVGSDARWVPPDAPPPQGYAVAMIYPAVNLAPHQVLSREIMVYNGPREYQTLQRIADRFNNKLDLIMNFNWAGFVSKGLLLGMNVLHDLFKLGYGWAIVLITFIIKLVFWPLTQASTRSMKRLQALQPQLNAIKEKYKDDPVKMHKKTTEFMRENKVNPLGGCLPMALQFPVFFGFYYMIQSAFELHGARFLWVHDLSRPDTLFIIPGLTFIPFFSIAGVGLPFNLLPLIMGATMLWQSHLTPPSPGMDPAQQKMMRFMPLLFLGFLYNYSAGLTLYWTVQNLLTILQTKLTRTTTQPAPAATPAKGPVLTAPQKKRK